jgi:hypothetical protein
MFVCVVDFYNIKQKNLPVAPNVESVVDDVVEL